MDIKSLREIGDALSASTIAYSKNNDQVQPVMTQEMNLVSDIKWMENLTNKVIRSKELPFSVKTDKRSKRKYIDSTKLGGYILNILKVNIFDIKMHYPLHQFNPYIELHIRNVEDRHLFELPWIIFTLNDNEVVRWRDVLNGYVDGIRKEGNSQKFKKTMSDYQRLANKNYRELMIYLKALFKRHSRLLVLRLDLGYLKEQCWPVGGGSNVQYDEVKKHWEVLLRYLKTKLPFDCMAGFAWRLEYGLDKNFHYHILILLDGSKVREDVTIARIIGEFWSNTVTKGAGLYYNCNAFKNSYKSCGIGMLHHEDTESLEGLEKAALYMVKTDYYLKMVAPGKGRTFGKGIMPEPKTETRGRPRTTTKLIAGEI